MVAQSLNDLIRIDFVYFYWYISVNRLYHPLILRLHARLLGSLGQLLDIIEQTYFIKTLLIIAYYI